MYSIFWESNDTIKLLSNTSVLFDRPPVSFTKKIIYIDRTKIIKEDSNWTRLYTLLLLQNQSIVTSFRTPHKARTLPSKLQREKWREKLSQELVPLLFSDPVLLHFFRGKPKPSLSSGYLLQTKIYRTCADKLPLSCPRTQHPARSRAQTSITGV